jgi:cytochrome c peroxidase
MRALLTVLLVAALPVAHPLASVLDFSAQERRQIASFGPWPMPVSADPSNRVSGKPEAIALGARLFFDARLSPIGYIACVTCHQPDRAWADGKARAHGLADVPRNTPALANLRLQRWFGWGGGADSLWMASLRPLLDPREFDSNAATVARVYVRDPDLACLYRRAFGEAATGRRARHEAVLVNTAKALAAFQETLNTGRTPFDEFRDALLRGDGDAAARYPVAAQQGLRLFIGRGNCIACHNGPNFSNGEFADVGVPYFIAPGQVDAGRHADLQNLRGSRYNLIGYFNDDAGGSSAQAIRHATIEPRHWGEFKVPSLRNAAISPPYMHNGSLPTLRDVLLHYSNLDESRIHSSSQPLLRALRLSEEEISALLAFLDTLTDQHGADRPRPARAECPPPGSNQVRWPIAATAAAISTSSSTIDHNGRSPRGGRSSRTGSRRLGARATRGAIGITVRSGSSGGSRSSGIRAVRFIAATSNCCGSSPRTWRASPNATRRAASRARRGCCRRGSAVAQSASERRPSSCASSRR